MNEMMVKEDVKIKDLIYEIRGKQVMLDRDLAKLYGCTNGTKDINKAAKRNMERFPNDFYFQLTKEEYYNILRSQNGTLELEQGKYSKYFPYVFTEQGVAMLDSDLTKLYECTKGTKTINQAVKGHRERFSNDFYFQLTDKGNHYLRSQIGTTNNMNRNI